KTTDGTAVAFTRRSAEELACAAGASAVSASAMTAALTPRTTDRPQRHRCIVLEEVENDAVDRVRLFERHQVRGLRDDGQCRVRYPFVEFERVREGDRVVIGHHHE